MNSLEIILSTEGHNIIPMSDTSQFGFVFLYNNSVNKFVLKISVLTDDARIEDPMLPIEYNSIQKRIDVYPNFIDEAKRQNEIYHKSYNKPFCPKLIDFYSIDSLYDQVAFLSKLKQISVNDSIPMIDNLLKNIYAKREKQYKLGVIAMEYADGYIPFSNFIKELNDNDDKREIYENIIFQAKLD